MSVIGSSDPLEGVIAAANAGPGSLTRSGVGLVAANPTLAVGLLQDLMKTRLGTVFVTGDGTTAAGLMIAHQPDIAVVEDRLLEIPGLDVVRVTRLHSPHTLVLLVTDELATIAAAAAAGIETCQREDLIHDVRARLDRLAA